MADRHTRNPLTYATRNPFTMLGGNNNNAPVATMPLSDENVQLLAAKGGVGGVGVKTLAPTHAPSNNLLPTSASMSNVFAASTNNMRNALGDIGNRQNMILAAKEAPFKGLATANTTTSTTMGKPVVQDVVDKMASHKECEPAPVELNESSIMEVSTSEVIDIDECDADNPQLVAEYVKDIYNYLNKMERDLRISPSFLDNKIVTAKMRSVLIDWLIQVHLKFHLLQETLYLCVQIIDAYLQVVDVQKMQLQLVGVTAMFLASKYEEMYVPAIEDFVYMTDNTYTKSEIRLMEISILRTLNFMFGKPLPLHFLRRFSKAGSTDPKQHTLAKYFMELSLHDAEFSCFDPSYLAACSLALSFRLLKGSEWNRTMEYYSTYNQASLWTGIQKLCKLVMKSAETDYKYKAATVKYGVSKCMRISLLPELSSECVKQLAAGKIPLV